jgi:hypothetical protein
MVPPGRLKMNLTGLLKPLELCVKTASLSNESRRTFDNVFHLENSFCLNDCDLRAVKRTANDQFSGAA